jgi:uncharacterized membrane protein (DUF4010 family)
LQDLLLPFGVALGLGLLVGFQRERTKAALAGVRTFPLITLAGALCGALSRELAAGWIVAAGLIALTALVLAGNVAGWRQGQGGVGTTTEVAALVMFLVGGLAVLGFVPLAVITGGVVAVLLHFKQPMHGLARKLSDAEVQALMRIVLIGLVILPALPDETYGPYEVLNPFRIWLMVVLIVGISVASFLLYRLVSTRTGTLLGGVLGGLISSTATTASHARRAGEDPGFGRMAAAVVMVASTVIFVRIFVEVGAVAPRLLPRIAAPLATLALFNVGLSAIGIARVRRREVDGPEREDPTELKAALVFGALYGVILFAVAAAKHHFGDAGLYGVATVSGLTDVDAITLSIATLADAGRVEVGTAWRAILLAVSANMVFKTVLGLALGGRAMIRPLALLFAPSLVAGLAILAFWPWE